MEKYYKAACSLVFTLLLLICYNTHADGADETPNKRWLTEDKVDILMDPAFDLSRFDWIANNPMVKELTTQVVAKDPRVLELACQMAENPSMMNQLAGDGTVFSDKSKSSMEQLIQNPNFAAMMDRIDDVFKRDESMSQMLQSLISSSIKDGDLDELKSAFASGVKKDTHDHAGANGEVETAKDDNIA